MYSLWVDSSVVRPVHLISTTCVKMCSCGTDACLSRGHEFRVVSAFDIDRNFEAFEWRGIGHSLEVDYV